MQLGRGWRRRPLAAAETARGSIAADALAAPRALAAPGAPGGPSAPGGRAAPAATAGGPPAGAPAAPEVARIEPGCGLDGRLVVERSLEIEGELRGRIECRGTVTVCERGAVEASIRARSVVIRGAVVGDIEAAREVVLLAGARLHGDVETPSLVIERGAVFNGRTRMFRPGAVRRERASETQPAPGSPAAPADPARA